ncbi:MAG: hypothetical protein QOD98_3956 [Nocardioidaceae bacterium]|nr:hypothetical protein [Nocardioidaceae bacterium]
MVSLSNTAPAAVLRAAREQVAYLDQRIWAAVSDDELVDGVAALEVLKSHLAAVQAELLSEVDVRDLAKKQLHWGSTADWYTHQAGLTRREGRRAVLHASRLVSERRDTLAALQCGDTSATQAGIICDAIEALPGDPALRARAETVMLENSRRLNATELARTGRHLVHVIDPDREERRLEAALARDERAVHLGRYLAVTEDGAGGVRIKGRGTVEDGALLRAALLPLTQPSPAINPDDPTCEAEVDPRDHGARMWDAMVEIAQHALDTDRAPAAHGANARLTVLIDHQTLVTQLGESITDDGLTLSAMAVRRLACDADIIPATLGTHGEVLDLGQTRRLVSAAQWRALVARDRHCAFPGCTRPPVMGHAHHILHWADGGPTNLDNLVLLCSAHHRVIHDTPWQVRLNPTDRLPEFLPPARGGLPPPKDWIRHRPRRE